MVPQSLSALTAVLSVVKMYCGPLLHTLPETFAVVENKCLVCKIRNFALFRQQTHRVLCVRCEQTLYIGNKHTASSVFDVYRHYIGNKHTACSVFDVYRHSISATNTTRALCSICTQRSCTALAFLTSFKWQFFTSNTYKCEILYLLQWQSHGLDYKSSSSTGRSRQARRPSHFPIPCVPEAFHVESELATQLNLAKVAATCMSRPLASPSVPRATPLQSSFAGVCISERSACGFTIPWFVDREYELIRSRRV
jgi:hypothetical protein